MNPRKKEWDHRMSVLCKEVSRAMEAAQGMDSAPDL